MVTTALIEHGIEVFFRQVEHVGAAEDAGIADADVEAAVAVNGLGDQAAHRRPVANIAGEETGPVERRRRGLALFAIDVGQDHLGALGGEGGGNACADPLRRPGDDGNLVFQTHFRLPPRWVRAL